MKIVNLIAAAMLAIFTLQGCGSSAADGTASQGGSAVTVKSGTGADATSPSPGSLLFILDSNSYPAHAVNGLRFTFTIPQGVEPALLPNPSFPDADTVEIDPARIALTAVSPGAVAVASFRRSTRVVEVGLISTEGLRALGSAFAAITFDVSPAALPLSATPAGDLLLEEVIGMQGALPVGSFTLFAATGQGAPREVVPVPVSGRPLP